MEYFFATFHVARINTAMNEMADKGWRVHTFDRDDMYVTVLFEREAPKLVRPL